MDEAQVIISLRTFSGPNLGAEVLLPPGIYVIGTDYSCDIVLSDSSIAPRHAALTAQQPQGGQLPRVYIKPLDAGVFLDEEPLPANGLEIPPAKPWFLGLTCLAWNTPHAPREEIIPRLPGQPNPASAQGDIEPLAKQHVSEPEQIAPASNLVGGNSPILLPKKKAQIVYLAGLLILIILGALVLDFQPKTDPAESQAAKLRQEIQQAGLNALTVSNENGRITVSGFVLNEKERGLIWRMAQNLNCPVYMQIGVREDMVQAVRMKFNTRGLFPEITFPGGGEVMNIAAYIKDRQTENAAFASLNNDMPDLPQIEKRIVHAEELQNRIERELAQAQLQNIRLAFGAGRVEVSDPHPSGNLDALRQVMEQVEEDLNIPLIYTIMALDPLPVANSVPEIRITPLQTEEDASSITTVYPENFSLEGVRITGVTMGSLRFINLGNEQRVFEGGMLPGGLILESITLDSLILSKNGRRTIYPLRGANE